MTVQAFPGERVSFLKRRLSMTPLVAAVAEKMMEYDRQDVRRINHFMKVYGYASVIGCIEGLDARTQETL